MPNVAAMDMTECSARMRIVVGALSGRLARLLPVLPGEGSAGVAPDATLTRAAEFLQSMAAHAAAQPPRTAWATRQDLTSAVHPFDRLRHALALAPLETDLVLLAGMAEEHEGYSSVFRSLHPRGEPRPTLALAAQLFCDSLAERTLFRSAIERGPAMRAGLLRVTGDAPFYERNLQLADNLWPVLHGIDTWPANLRAVADRIALCGLEEWLRRFEPARAIAALQSECSARVLVTGESERTAAHRAMAVVTAAGRQAIHLTTEDATLSGLQLATLHAVARNVVPIVEISSSSAGTNGPASLEVPADDQVPGALVLCTRTGAPAIRSSRPIATLAVQRLSASALRRMWESALPELASESATLGARYPLEPAIAVQVADSVRSAARLDGRTARLDDIRDSVQEQASHTLSNNVKRVRPTAGWEQLVLPTDRLALLREMLGRLQHQFLVLDEWRLLDRRPGARGVRALFSGPPGTGKTLSAEVLASALAVDLLVVDLSRVVSKWIGETEKNLAEVFDAAEHTPAVLLFDEADALFGRRTEVSDAHDRYANLETAYLLSRLERFEGLAILSTNLKENIDAAFLRRLEFVLEFPEPAVAERKALWECHLPPTAPLAADVDLAELAAFYHLVGGTIRNAAVAAAFLAAEDDQPIGRGHLHRALLREYEKSGKAFPGVPVNRSATYRG